MTYVIEGEEATRPTPDCCEPTCAAQAEFEVTHACGDPYDATYACVAHVGVLMGHLVGAGGDPNAHRWFVDALVTADAGG